MLFEVRDLTKVFGDRTVLDIAHLYFEKGLIYSLLGPNGSGKTTLLEILSLLAPPTTGRIRYNDREVVFTGNNLTPLRREIVMVQQSPVLFTTTVYKNLEFGLKIRGISKKERGKIIEGSLDLVGMRDFMNAEAHKLSGGETQRVAIAQALACSPRVMFFDEPTSNVDVENQIAIERIMMEINSQKEISVIFTTHNLNQASKLSSKVISLFEGRMAPSIFENIFSGKIVQDEDGNRVCSIQDKIRLMIDTEKKGDVRLSIDPLKIEIMINQDIQHGKNIFKGRIIQLTYEQDHIRVVVDIGIPLNILLPMDQPRNEPLIIGDEVWIFCPQADIRIF
ncbi:MAG: ABC transporter ATP-binding protein [Deltaproteobacteria bacterium]|nr:ABC transporter ATP-binding protein [Deltaproteobacteria bacterium]